MKLTIDGTFCGLSRTLEVETKDHQTVGDLLKHVVGLDEVKSVLATQDPFVEAGFEPVTQANLFLGETYLAESAHLDELFGKENTTVAQVNLTLMF